MAKYALVVDIDFKKLRKAINDGENTESILKGHVDAITDRANAMSSAFRTGIYHVDGHRVGNTQPVYGGDIKKTRKGPVGIVHPKNYAAMKDNHLNNTLLKAGR